MLSAARLAPVWETYIPITPPLPPCLLVSRKLGQNVQTRRETLLLISPVSEISDERLRRATVVKTRPGRKKGLARSLE